MKIILFSHPSFISSQSMPRFALMLEQAYRARGHEVQVWSPQARLYKRISTGALAKWAGYIDQYVLFSQWVRKQVKLQPEDTLYVFCDQALGPWVPLVKHHPHVVHVHDLLALRSALGDVPENPTRWTGRLYQRYIRAGFKQSLHFISISDKTRHDLHAFGKIAPLSSEVVYNGINYPYCPLSQTEALAVLARANLQVPPEGVLLHVGGSQWYKNMAGVIRIYIAYAKAEVKPLPLWCVSPKPSTEIVALLKTMPALGEVKFIQGIDNQALHALYAVARAFLFPSLAEGFGWPIVEAQACGCPVITTNEAPMNEIGGNAATYLSRLKTTDDPDLWAKVAAQTLQELLILPDAQREALVSAGITNAARFDTNDAIEGYLKIYRQVLASGQDKPANPKTAFSQKASE